MSKFSKRFLSGMAVSIVAVVMSVGCEGSSSSGSDSKSTVDGVELYRGRLTIAAGTTAQTPIVTAPGPGVIVTDLSVPEDGVSVTAWLEDSDSSHSRLVDVKTGPVLTLSAVTGAGQHWRTQVENANATLLHVNISMRYQP